jgi:CheY-like chemotaxis protein
MKSLAAPRQLDALCEPRLKLLLADDDDRLRALEAGRACEVVEGLIVLEAKNGAEAIQIGLQQRPQLALLDADMPRVGGIEVAMTLRELQPQMRLALQTADPPAYRGRARECRLPLFDKLQLDRVFNWLELQAQSFVEARILQPKRRFECSACGYSIARSVPPERCPMCQREDTWINSRWRSYSADYGFV